MKRLVFSALVAASALAASPGLADKKSDNAAKALAGIVALGVLGAAVAEHQHDEGYNAYRPHPDLPPNENVVGICMHYGLNIVKRAGGYDFELEDVRRIDRAGSTSIVTFYGTGYYPRGKKTSLVECQVRANKVVAFNYN